jgi:hypothetical protein
MIPRSEPPREYDGEPTQAKKPRRTLNEQASIVARLLDFPALVTRIPFDVLDSSAMEGLSDIVRYLGEAGTITAGQALAVFSQGPASLLVNDAIRDPLFGQLTIEDATAEIDDFVRAEKIAVRRAQLLELSHSHGLNPAERKELDELSM